MSNRPKTYAITRELDDALLMSALDLVGEPPGTTRSQSELAAYWGRSKQRVQQVECAILKKLRERLEAAGLTSDCLALLAHRDRIEISDWSGSAFDDLDDQVREACDAFFLRREMAK